MWAERDAAVVWHGFTDMAAYLDHCPVVVERAEGHELIDTEGRRYLDAISSLWVNTHGPPGARARPGRARPARPGGPLDHARQRQPGGGRAGRGAGRGGAVVDPHFMFCSDGASAVEQALKLAFQFWALAGVRGRTTYLAFGAAYHGDTVGSLSLGADDGFGASLFSPLRFPVLRAPGYDDPSCFDVACRMVDEHAGRLAAVVVEPLVQGAAGMRMAPPEGFAALAAACRAADVLLDPRRGGHRLRAHRHPVRHRAVRAGRAARPAVPRQGHHRRVPAAGGHGGQRAGVRRLRRHPVRPRPLLRGQRPGRRGGPAPPAPARRARRAGQRGRALGPARRPCWPSGWRRWPACTASG